MSALCHYQSHAAARPSGIQFRRICPLRLGRQHSREGMNSWLRLLAILASLILIGSPAAAKYPFPSRLDALSKEARIDVVKRPNMPDSGDQPTLVIDDLTFKYDPDVWVRCHP